MIFDESLCFEITVNGTNADVKKLVSAIKSGAFDDFFEFDEEMLSFDDDYDTAGPDEATSMLFSSEFCGVQFRILIAFELSATKLAGSPALLGLMLTGIVLLQTLSVHNKIF